MMLHILRNDAMNIQPEVLGGRIDVGAVSGNLTTRVFTRVFCAMPCAVLGGLVPLLLSNVVVPPSCQAQLDEKDAIIARQAEELSRLIHRGRLLEQEAQYGNVRVMNGGHINIATGASLEVDARLGVSLRKEEEDFFLCQDGGSFVSPLAKSSSGKRPLHQGHSSQWRLGF